ncbi:hypothetical protein XENOCAPTIV_016903 [Xenoophorus captivus]|uniref:Uncharacterized protein n=1 Tax=Xenoophorus captivus TaxID=1517983 RepID=A0ABV0RR57_9TELE
MVGKHKLLHSLVVSPDTAVNLLGRDILIALGATLVVTFPDGPTLHAADGPEAHQYLLQSVEEPCVDVYQGFIEPETPSSAGVRSSFLIWKPWIQALPPCGPIPALPRVTLFYDRNEKTNRLVSGTV